MTTTATPTFEDVFLHLLETVQPFHEAASLRLLGSLSLLLCDAVGDPARALELIDEARRVAIDDVDTDAGAARSPGTNMLLSEWNP